jgi:hypothetical protein
MAHGNDELEICVPHVFVWKAVLQKLGFNLLLNGKEIVLHLLLHPTIITVELVVRAVDCSIPFGGLFSTTPLPSFS